MMKTEMSSREFRDGIVGKRISGVIARPGRAGQPPMVLMLRFDDGSVAEFVSPRSDQILRRSVRTAPPAGSGSLDFESGEFELMQLPLNDLASSHGPN
jgi:hypothetical protein